MGSVFARSRDFKDDNGYLFLCNGLLQLLRLGLVWVLLLLVMICVAWESHKVLGVSLWILISNLFDFIALAFGDLNRLFSVLCISRTQRRLIILGIWEDLVSWLGEVELLVLRMVRVVMVSVAEEGRREFVLISVIKRIRLM